METLYCFKLNRDEGRIERYVIDKYSVVTNRWSSDRDELRFCAKLGCMAEYYYNLKRYNIGRFIHDKVFLYEDDFNKAINIILDALQLKADTAKHEMNRNLKLKEKILKCHS